MKNEPRNPDRVLSHGISGFHQYILTPVPRLSYVSEHLCELLGLTTEELLAPGEDRYALRVHPADRQRYEAFLTELASREQSKALDYRLVKKDGSILYVSDSMTSRADGDVMCADSVVTDITRLTEENRNLRFLSQTMPCGFLKYSCEKPPRITYLNHRMKELLGFSGEAAGGFDELELYLQNVYLMIPPEERRRFALYLERVRSQGGPIAGEMTVLRRDGTRVCLFGWVTKCVNEQGQEEFQSACMDITARQSVKAHRESRRYLRALAQVYDTVLQYDLNAGTMKCLYQQELPLFQQMENVPMQSGEATEKWIAAAVAPEDQSRVREFLREALRPGAQSSELPPQIRYRGSSGSRMGVFLKLDGGIRLLCCRRAHEEIPEELRQENDRLKNMQQLVLRFTEGVVAFEVDGGLVRPMYVSENVCGFFGYTREQWLALSEKRPTIREFIARSGIAYSDVQRLFAEGEALFSYFDRNQGAYRRIKAICSQKHSGAGVKTYVMLYNVDTTEPGHSGPAVRIRTFGYFDVFVEDKPIAFRNEKSKELLALLVDRRGGFVSSEEAISFLWENEQASPVTLARYRKVALRLKNLLEEYGISHIVESVNGKRRIAAEAVQCDLYDYLSGAEQYAQLFKGSYLTNYSWGENTLAELTGDHLQGAGL